MLTVKGALALMGTPTFAEWLLLFTLYTNQYYITKNIPCQTFLRKNTGDQWPPVFI